ncbi:glycosyltransferase [Pusillimonas caeni]|uniref:glycosyltransferase n=1 Tax=Pusillimonas caeni TaxID=1348472 RepID=UPI00142FD449|nr:glycosyltransferase [Pusillimonas caeni]
MNMQANNSELGTIFSLVANSGTADARVMKQARALTRAGYRVRIYARSEEGYPAQEKIDGIEITRFDCYSFEGISREELEALLTELDLYSLFSSHLDSAIDINTRLQAISPHYSKLLLELRTVGARVTKLKQTKARLKAEQGTQKRSFPQAKILRLLRRIKERLIGKNQNSNSAYKTATVELSNEIKIRDQIRASLGNFENVQALNKELHNHMFYMRYALFAANISRLELDQNPDIIHSHDLYTLVGAIALASKTGAKVIFDAHEIETERTPSLALEKKEFIDMLERTLLTNVQQVITCCDSSKEFYSKRFSRSIPEVVMNAPDFSDIKNDEPIINIRATLGLTENEHLLIYTGGVGREGRGMDKVVAALSFLPDVHLAILGPRHQLNDAWLQEAAHKEGTYERVHLLPSVPANLVVNTIRTADVGVCAFQDISLNHRYAMPNKLFEMTFADIPICVSNLPEMANFVERLGNGLTMDETCPRSIANSIQQILNHPGKYKLTEHSYAVLQSEFSWNTQAKKLINTYSNLIGVQ